MKISTLGAAAIAALLITSLPPAAAAQSASGQSPQGNSLAGQMPVIGSMLRDRSGSGPNPAAVERARQLQEEIDRGETLLKSGNRAGAILAFQNAVRIDPQDGLARQRLAEGYTAAGQLDKALATYRTLFYVGMGNGGSNGQANDPTPLMNFALVLLQTGQEVEALTAYQRAAALLDHEDGQAHALGVDLPEFRAGPGQAPYSPQALEAMAHLAIGIGTSGYDVAELRLALALAPDSAAANFYLGKYLYDKDNVQAKALLERAIQLGDDRTVKAAKETLQFIR